MFALTLVLALFVGIGVGVLGSGGTVMSVPLLAYVAGMGAKQAIATAHLVVAVTSAVTIIPFLRVGRIQWRTGALLGGAGFVGAYIGGLLARFFSDTILLIGFAGIVILTGAAMLRPRQRIVDSEGHKPSVGVLISGGLAIGLVSGLVGAGGGVFVVPFLTLVGGVSVTYAVGTSLLVVTLNSFAGLGGYLAHVHLDARLATAFTAITVIGGQIGAHLHARVDPNVLRYAFGFLALAIAAVTVGKEINPASGFAVAALTGLAAAIAFVHARVARRGRIGVPASDAPSVPPNDLNQPILTDPSKPTKPASPSSSLHPHPIPPNCSPNVRDDIGR